MKQTFFEFNNDLHGFNVHSKITNANIPRYELYWSGFTFFEIKSKFNLIKRER